MDNRMNDFILIEELVPGRIVMEESVYGKKSPFTIRNPQTPIPTTKAVQIFRGILKGIYYCHAHNVVHGDLKVSNVMVENSWEELPSDGDALDLTSQPTSPTTQFDSANGDSLWSPQPIGSEKKEGMYWMEGVLMGREKAPDHNLRKRVAKVIEANENRVRIIDFGVSYESSKGSVCFPLFTVASHRFSALR